MGKHTPNISVCIVCRNEADKLEACLASVTWAKEIIVMDLCSTDASRQVAERQGARVFSREPYPIVEPLRNELASIADGEWILALDPDEAVTPGLAEELKAVAERDDVDAVVLPRMNYDFGYPPTGPGQRYEPQLRMYRRSRVRWPIVPNALPEVDNARKYFIPARDNLVLIHQRSKNIPEVLDRVVRYAPAQAQSMLDAGQIFSARAMLKALFTQVDRKFFRERAWNDGVPGLLRAGILVAFKFYVWACFWQLSGAQRTPSDDLFVQRFGRVAHATRTIIGYIAGAPRYPGRAKRRLSEALRLRKHG